MAGVRIYYAHLLNKWPINLLGWGGGDLLEGDFQSSIIKSPLSDCLALFVLGGLHP